ncbi:DUF1552 domain-containing protein [Alienimonas sp. DA493]|uniref:DUF1552 domain-containing protein n=1 Tax=Alienimonas sp. DA493 TaxID=3373605 RepID=UPI0037552BBA
MFSRPRLSRETLSRRSLLRGAAGVSVALPLLDAMGVRACSEETADRPEPGRTADGAPKRAVFCMWGLGLNGRDFTPQTEGPDFETTPILAPLERRRGDFTVVSGLKLTHSGGHGGDRTFLTGTATHEAGSELRISCDQELAAVVGRDTRYRSLVLGVKRGTGFGQPQDHTLSWTKSGTPLPAENRPHVLFDQLFRPDSVESVAAREAAFARRSSVLDSVLEDARDLHHALGAGDRAKLDEYLTGVRDLEVAMQEQKSWLHRPKPEVDPIDFGSDQGLDPSKSGLDYRRYQRLMFDVITLALQTDSTRVVSYMPRMDNSDGTGAWKSEGNPYGYHTMTHHGEDPDKLKWFTRSDVLYMQEWAYFLDKLKSVKEGEGTLLDHCLVTWGSTGGTINAHNNHHLPAILCGGAAAGIRHRGHLVQEDRRLGDLWETVFKAMDVPTPADFQGGEADGPIADLLA